MIYSSVKDYLDKLQEAGRKSPASWIVVSPRIAEHLEDQIKKFNHKNKIKLKK